MTVEDGKLYAILTANGYPSVENRFNLVVYATTVDGFSYKVSKTVEIQNEHAGGTATCIELAICDTCGAEYGELNPNNHTGTEIRNEVKATCTETGYSGDTYCTGCGALLATGTVLDITPHNYSRTVVEPTENKQGYTKYVCTDCGTEETKTKDEVSAMWNIDYVNKPPHPTDVDNSSYLACLISHNFKQIKFEK